MASRAAYDVVRVGSEDEDSIDEELVDEEEEGYPPKAIKQLRDLSLPQVSSLRFSSIIAIMIFCFLVGVVVGNLLPSMVKQGILDCNSTTAMLDSNFTTTSSADEKSVPVVVSYNFLKTTHGKDVLASLIEQLNEGGPSQTLRALSNLMEVDDQIADSCHPLAHMLGRKAFRDSGFEGAFAGLPGTPDDVLLRTCNAAYMHGIIEHYLMEADDLSQAVDFVERSLCQVLTSTPHSFVDNKWECQHGIGHGIIQYVRAVKEKEILDESLNYCHVTSTQTTNCRNGVWMDYFASTRLTTMLEPSSLQVCVDHDSIDCALYAPTEYLLHHPRDYVGAILFCKAGFDDGDTAGFCYDGVGTQAGKENMHDFSPVEAACSTLSKKREQSSCFSSAITYYEIASGLTKIPSSVCKNVKFFKHLC